jgi:NADH-quinone oxidoreductase subunit C
MVDDTPPTDIASPEPAAESAATPLIEDSAVAAVFTEIDPVAVVERRYASSDASYFMVSVAPDVWVEAVASAKTSGFDFFIDLYAADHFRDAPRYEVGINVVNTTENRRLIISTRLPYDAPTIPTVTGVFAGANFYEREAYDLFGIEFVGHPDLTRILLPDDWDGHPLRKDYAVGAIPVQFKAGSVDL